MGFVTAELGLALETYRGCLIGKNMVLSDKLERTRPRIHTFVRIHQNLHKLGHRNRDRWYLLRNTEHVQRLAAKPPNAYYQKRCLLFYRLGVNLCLWTCVCNS